MRGTKAIQAALLLVVATLVACAPTANETALTPVAVPVTITLPPTLTETPTPEPTPTPTSTPTPEAITLDVGTSLSAEKVKVQDEQGHNHYYLRFLVPVVDKDGKKIEISCYAHRLLEQPAQLAVEEDELGMGIYITLQDGLKVYLPYFYDSAEGEAFLVYKGEMGGWVVGIKKGEGEFTYKSLAEVGFTVAEGQKVVFENGYYRLVDSQGQQIGEEKRAVAVGWVWPPIAYTPETAKLVDFPELLVQFRT